MTHSETGAVLKPAEGALGGSDGALRLLLPDRPEDAAAPKQDLVPAAICLRLEGDPCFVQERRDWLSENADA